AFSQAVASLPPACRTVFILRKFEGLTNREIANRLKISISAVEKHIAVGIEKCSAHLIGNGYEPTEFGAAAKRRFGGPSRDSHPSRGDQMKVSKFSKADE
ncbi:MAG: winged helix-turn-helix transcriptional regulator, partial [Alphaproteobacteria bacterium]